MPFFKSTTLRADGLTAGLLMCALVVGCHFEAHVGSSADAKEQPKSQSSKATDKDKKADDKKKDEPAKATDKDKTDEKKDEPAKTTDKDKTDEKKDEPAKQDEASVQLPGNLVFDAGKSTLKEGAATTEVLNSLKTYLEQQTRVTLLRIEGHSDNAAAPAENLRISGERALSVKQWLVGKGIAESRLAAVGFGEKKPIADNSTEQGRAQNRRVEFKIAKINGKPYLGNDPLGGGTEFK
jgi:outer membrane protein OmpA-like peptidoglycan-associated protein